MKSLSNILLLAAAIVCLSGCVTATAPADGIPEPLPIELYAD